MPIIILKQCLKQSLQIILIESKMNSDLKNKTLTTTMKKKYRNLCRDMTMSQIPSLILNLKMMKILVLMMRSKHHPGTNIIYVKIGSLATSMNMAQMSQCLVIIMSWYINQLINLVVDRCGHTFHILMTEIPATKGLRLFGK